LSKGEGADVLWPFDIAALGGLVLGLFFKAPALIAASFVLVFWLIWEWWQSGELVPGIVALVVLQSCYLAGLALRLHARERRRAGK